LRRYVLSAALTVEATDIADAWAKLAVHFTAIAKGEPSSLAVGTTHLKAASHSQQYAFKFPSPSTTRETDEAPTRPDHKVISREDPEDKEK
jgi:hypothetical protein